MSDRLDNHREERPPEPLDCKDRSAAIPTVTLTLFRFEKLPARLWAFGMMGAARPAMARLPGLEFWKLCGAGVGEGFTPKLDMGIVGILGAWRDAQTAKDGLRSGVYEAYQMRASERWSVTLAPERSRGAWSGQSPFGAGEVVNGPVAVLTRATLKLRALPGFWDQTPAVSRAIGADPNVIFKIGLGEVPYLHQITFSIWPDTERMAAFAHRDGPHAQAVRAVREADAFREELYARFGVVASEGTWGGTDPLAGLDLDHAA